MIRLVKYLKDHFAEIARAVIVAAIYFVLAYLVDSPARLAISFLAVTVLLVIGRVFYPSGLEDDLEELEGSVEKMAEGNLSVSKPTLASSSAVIRDFSTSLLVLAGQLKQIVEKVKNVAGSVSRTSERIVELSRGLLKSGQHQSEASEKASHAMSRSMLPSNASLPRLKV